MYLLYRDAVPNFYTYRSWGPQIDAARSAPGLIVCPDDDPYASADLSRQTARRLGAEFVVLPGKSHYWMHQDPDVAVRLLRGFWQRTSG